MKQNNEQEIKQKMLQISALIEKDQTQDESLDSITYYKDFNFKGSGLAENDIYIAKIENEKEKAVTYEIYSGKTNSLIATVNTQGKLEFMPEYIENLKKIDERYVQRLKLEDLDFELPEELQKDDIVLSKEEREYIKQKEKQESVTEEKDNDEKVKEDEELKEDVSSENSKEEEIASKKGIPSHNVLFIRENSNLYKDHPNLEPNLYFYRDIEGIVRAEYIDKDGSIKPSRYFEPSQTSVRQETVSLGDDGNPVTKEVPYQVMKTKGLNNVDKDIRDIRINIDIDQYGYLEIEEARQGRNGDWLSHDIEVKGRNYNSRAVNESTSIKNRKADPDRQTDAYEQAEKNELDIEDGIKYNQMYLVAHAEEFIDMLVKEGYQKNDATKILNYMLGEENLNLAEAKERVNEEIGNSEMEKAQKQENLEDEEYERTPWGDAQARDQRRRI